MKSLTAPAWPWQSPRAERLIASIPRECLDEVLVLSERHLSRMLTCYFVYDHQARPHLSLDKDAPDGPPIEPPERVAVDRVAIAEQVSRRGVVGDGVHDLLGRPGGYPDEEHTQARGGEGVVSIS